MKERLFSYYPTLVDWRVYMQLSEYLNKNFPGLVLRPSLYYQWKNSIHFELAKGLYQIKSNSDELNPHYFNTVYYQATTLFNKLFSDGDQLYLVTNIYQYKNNNKTSRKKMKVYHHYVKNKNLRYRLKQTRLPYMFDDEEDAVEKCTSQFSLYCHKQDLRYELLIKAICNQDFHELQPRLHNPFGLYEPDIFFINTTKDIIFYIYDDRGCEVIAKDIETIRPLYEKYIDWVDEYCYGVISVLFKKL